MRGASSLTSRLSRGPGDASGFLPIPYVARLLAGIVLALVATRLDSRWGEPLLVIAVVVALPTLWFTALSTLVAIVPLYLRPGNRITPSPSNHQT